MITSRCNPYFGNFGHWLLCLSTFCTTYESQQAEVKAIFSDSVNDKHHPVTGGIFMGRIRWHRCFSSSILVMGIIITQLNWHQHFSTGRFNDEDKMKESGK